MELIATLKEGVVASFIPMVKEEEQPRDRSSSSFGNTTGIALTSGQPSLTLSRMAQGAQTDVSAVDDPPLFEPLRLFIAHLEVEYGGFKCNHM